MADPQPVTNAEEDPTIEVDANDGQGFQQVEEITSQLQDSSIAGNEEIEALPRSVQLRIEALKLLQREQAQLEDQFEKERRVLELKYEKLFSPLYQKRANVVSGQTEIEAVKEQAVDDGVKGIPGFWLRAFMNHSATAEIIQDHDVPAISYLKDVRSCSHEYDNGFKLEFEFTENPYFEETVLTKEYDVADASDSGDAVLKDVKGCAITWKNGQDLTKRTKKVKQRAKGGKMTRVVARTEEQESFFEFFKNVSMPTDDQDEDQSSALMEQLTVDFQIGFTIHENIIPQAVLWFTGEIEEEHESDAEDEEGYEDDESDSDEGGSEEENGEKQKYPALQNNPDGTTKPPECKNQ